MTDEPIDITRPLGPGVATWPGDAPYRLSWTMRRSDGAPVNVGALHTSLHNGTHADAPYHVDNAGARIAEVPLASYLGRARLVAVEPDERIERGQLEPALGDGATRLLVRTGCWHDPGRFPERYPVLTDGAAALLVERGIVLFGTDAPSVDPVDSERLANHHRLIGGGVGILENLLLDGVAPGEYELIALPLRLSEGDASPVRAVLRRLP